MERSKRELELGDCRSPAPGVEVQALPQGWGGTPALEQGCGGVSVSCPRVGSPQHQLGCVMELFGHGLPWANSRAWSWLRITLLQPGEWGLWSCQLPLQSGSSCPSIQRSRCPTWGHGTLLQSRRLPAVAGYMYVRACV
ncbi:dnaJ-like protein subfamily C member 5-like [Platysternon megacephalum]|uniref:DnaJ-like protein subfamily C member 5-like n=1 Tax=Platysternon megacephalum TaxID=55544 RepID=A0A4D9DQR1_9SAUR|nr:dnaJ-like protein subfamily C member 5-like [Platysternon megacephalum]